MIIIDTSKSYSVRSSLLNNVIHNDIDENTYNSFIREYKKIKKTDDFDLIITTKGRGPSTIFALMIANVIVNHSGKVTAKIPSYALGTGTLIALMCGEIQMTSYACLGTINPTFLDIDLKFIKHAVAMVNDKIFEEPSLLQILSETLNSHISNLDVNYDKKIQKLLKKKYTTSQIEEINLSFNKSHSSEYPISLDEVPSFLSIKMYDDVVIVEDDDDRISLLEDITSETNFDLLERPELSRAPPANKPQQQRPLPPPPKIITHPIPKLSGSRTLDRMRR